VLLVRLASSIAIAIGVGKAAFIGLEFMELRPRCAVFGTRSSRGAWSSAQVGSSSMLFEAGLREQQVDLGSGTRRHNG